MRHPRLTGWKGAWPLAAALALGAALFPAARSGAAVVTAGTGSGLAGATVDITISTTDLTGLGVTSLQFDLTYNASIVTATNVLEIGTMTGAAGWNNPTFSVTSVLG